MVWHPTWQEWTIIGAVVLLLLLAWLAVACRFLPCCCIYRLVDARKINRKGEDQDDLKVHKWAAAQASVEELDSPTGGWETIALETVPLRTDHNSYGTGKRRDRMKKDKTSPDRLSTNSSDSCGSLLDDDTPSLPGGEPGRGQLVLTLQRNTFKSQVVLKVHRAQNLWAFTPGAGIQETFCLIHLLRRPEGADMDSTKKKPPKERHLVYEGRTTPRRRTRHPEFNEEFTLPVTLSEIASCSLVVTVCSYDRHDVLTELGEVHVDFEEVDLVEGETILRDLEEVEQGDKGSLCVSLCYRPTAEKLTLVLLEASSLALPLGQTGDIIAKVNVMEKGKVRVRRKGKHHPALTNMSFDKDLIFLDIPPEHLQNIALLVILTQTPGPDEQDTIKIPVTFGKVVIGLNLGLTAHHHWMDMTKNPREPVIHTHVIR